MGPEQALSATPPPDPGPQQSRQQTLLQKVSSFQVLLGAILVTGVFVAERSIRIDPDTWWHIKVGSDILATHRFPFVDHYSFTARGAPWIAYEWLGNVVMSLAARAGLVGTELLLVAASSLIALLIYYYAWLKCKECKAAFLATVTVVPLAILSMTVRPQLFGYAFLLITLICLERFRQGHRSSLWILPLLVLVLLFVVALLTLRLGLSLVEMALLIFATYETCVHVHFAIVFAIVFAPLLAGPLVRWVTPYDPAIDKYALNTLLVLVMAAAWIKYFLSRADLEGEVAARFPVAAVRYLRQHPLPGRRLNSCGSGGHLIRAGDPPDGVSIDGRAALHKYAGVVGSFRRILGLAPDTQQLLGRFAVDSSLLQRGTPLATFLGADPAWTRVYEDKLAELYVRKGAGKNSRNRNPAQTQAPSEGQN